MIQLFRGVEKNNKTQPEKYSTDGLLTKQVNSGDHPEPHHKYGWLATILKHIHFDDEVGRYIYDTSQYLSFSKKINVARSFIKGLDLKDFDETHRFTAEAYLFTVTLEDNLLSQIQEGVFLYRYNCNYNRYNTDYKFYGFVEQFCRCKICSVHPAYEHKLLVVDVEQYLRKHKKDYPEEYEKAKWDQEWLLMPMDPMLGPSGRGYQSRIAIANFWTVDYFKYVTL